MKNLHNTQLALSIITLVAHSALVSANPYNFPGPAVQPGAGAGLPEAKVVPGKEYSHFQDRAASGVATPEQVVGWDGIGGTIDAINFFGNEPQTPSTTEIDAIGYHNDALFEPLLDDNATLIFSVGNGTSPTGSGQTVLASGDIIGRAGDLSYESPLHGGMGIWATAAEIDAENPPVDVDGVELWGRENPGFNTNRYSLVGDANNGNVLGSGISVYCNGCGSLGNAYVVQDGIRDDVASLLGIPEDFGVESMEIDLDAMIIGDTGGENSIFVTGEDEIIFSIRQIPMPGQPNLFYATGSEIFVKRRNSQAEFLHHGGHLWDRDWALANMQSDGRQLDINALEVASIPEPGSMALAGVMALVILGVRRI